MKFEISDSSVFFFKDKYVEAISKRFSLTKEKDTDIETFELYNYYVDINTLEELKKLAKIAGGYSLIVDFKNKLITIYDGYIE